MGEGNLDFIAGKIVGMARLGNISECLSRYELSNGNECLFAMNAVLRYCC